MVGKVYHKDNVLYKFLLLIITIISPVHCNLR